MSMGTVINTNIMSLNAQRNLGSSQGQLATSLERLSSGLRINSARDDAAGLAISERFTAQINGQNQAVRNANDGISFSQTAEGALDEVSNLLQRVRELAVQSANDTNSASDRRALNEEVQQAISEVQRIATSTQFNDQNVLDGSLDDLVFQVGANRGQTISVSGVDARSSELGARIGDGSAISQDAFDALTLDGDSLAINGEEIDLSGVDSIGGVITEINNAFADTDVQAARAEQAVTGDLEFSTTGTGETGEVTINNVAIDINSDTSRDDLVEAINAESAATGVTAEAGEGAEDIVLTSNGDIDVAVDGDGASLGEIDDGESDSFLRGIELSTDVGQAITVTGDDIDALGIDFDADPDEDARVTDFSADSTSVLTRSDADEAIRTMDFSIQQVSGLRSELGAVQNRFEATIANLQVGSENLTAARSRIQDTDFAQETAELTRAQILQQAGTSILSQANAVPQTVLGLLQ